MSTESSAPDRNTVQSILGEAFGHFRIHLDSIQKSNDPEAVHLARIGWRRFKSALHLFKPVLLKAGTPDSAALKPMLKALSRLRDLDVARFQTLPKLSGAYMEDSPAHAREWARLTRLFADADRQQRRALRAVLQEPAVQGHLNEISLWVGKLSSRGELFAPFDNAHGAMRSWARRRVRQMRRQMRKAEAHADTAQRQHRARILAKHLRYSIEMLRNVLPDKTAEKWHREAIDLQTRIGQTRDTVRANTLARELKLPSEIAEHLQRIASRPAEEQ